MPPELSPEVRALRTSVGLYRDTTRTILEVRGAAALDAIDALVSSDLFVRNGRMLHTFVLDPQGCPEADLLVAVDDEGAFVLADGLSAAELAARLEVARGSLAAPSSGAMDVRDRGASDALVSLHGPYAWELLSEVLGDDVLGLPYLAFCRFSEVLCFRAGSTGEFGYELLGAPAAIDALTAAIEARLVRFDGCALTEATLETAALENGFFKPSLLAGAELDARQQQQQWRLSTRKPFAGRDAIDRGRAERTPVLVHADADGRVAGGERVLLDGAPIGTVVVSRPSEVLGRSAMRVLVPCELAHPGLDRLLVETASGPVRGRTVSSPMLLNRSLYVDPRNHSYHDADSRPEPPLVRSLGDEARGEHDAPPRAHPEHGSAT